MNGYEHNSRRAMLSGATCGGVRGDGWGHHSADVERIFAACFEADWSTRLEGGATEPLYLPATANAPARLCYRADYFASAIHETAHWCIAGPARRRLIDFGYWYHPDGRDADAQRAFEAVEARPQALEWVFSVAAGYRFRPSADNLHGSGAGDDFGARVARALHDLLRQGLPPRAQRFADALSQFYGTPGWRDPSLYPAWSWVR